MDFRTLISLSKSDVSISHQSSILSMGSCFAENIGNRLFNLKFNIDVNPFGILYNPASIANSIEMLLQKKEFTATDLFFDNDIWSSLYHHSCFSNPDKERCLRSIQQRIDFASKKIAKCDILLITFGTAWVYKHIATNSIVSNCHKIPSQNFTRYKLTIPDIATDYKLLIDKLLSINPNIKIIFSVSPIRHWKDGAHENQLSKSTLLLAIEELQQYSKSVSYFPSYEILMDDLRDYRFYEADMLHPNSIAIDYIWEQLITSYFSQNTSELCNKIKQLMQAKNHRPFNANTENHKRFLEIHYEKTEKLYDEFSYLNLKEELEYFKQ